jgi:hypothetical protein
MLQILTMKNAVYRPCTQATDLRGAMHACKKVVHVHLLFTVPVMD